MTKTDSTPHAEKKGAASGGLLKKAARAIGSAVGTAAAKTGLAHAEASEGPRTVNGKLQKSHKHRLPRKFKKHQKKTLLAQQTSASAKQHSE